MKALLNNCIGIILLLNTAFTAQAQSANSPQELPNTSSFSSAQHSQHLLRKIDRSKTSLRFEPDLNKTNSSLASCGTPNLSLFGSRNVSGSTAEVYWVAVSGAISYKVEYRIRNVGASYSAPISTTTTFVTLTGLSASTKYEFIVQAVCSGNILSAFSSSGWFTTTAATSSCGTPNLTYFGYRNLTGNTAEVYWNTVAGAISYNVEYRIRNVGALYSAPLSTTTTALIITGLTPSTKYEFIVQAVCPGNALSTFSPSGWFTTTAVVTTCPTPVIANFGTRNVTGSSAEIFWAAVAGAISYNIEFRVRNVGATYSAPISTSAPSIVLFGLTPTTNYEFIIQTVCSNGSSSAFSSSGWFSTISGGGTTTTHIRGPYLTIATSNSITIQWRTSTSVGSEVKYGLSSAALTNIASNANVSTEHSITIGGLVTNTKYYYSIGQSGTILQGDISNFFFTAPQNGSTQALKFWVTGDFGNGSATQLAVRNSFTTNTSGQNVNGWLWLGDNAYNNGTDAEYQSKVFDVYTSIFKSLPVFPAPGNHDYAQSGYQSSAAMGTNFPYFSIFALPVTSGTEKYYSSNYGNVHFISLDSYGSYNTVGSLMYNWLQNDLSSNTQQWTIVYFHHPPYSKGSHDSDTEIEMVNMRNNIVPLLESFGVDLVLSGHSHNYERSFFLKNQTGPETAFNSGIYPAGNVVQSGAGPYIKTSRTGNGTVYIVCGVSGQANGTTTPGYPHNAMYKSISTSNGSLILDINGNTLTCKYLNSTGVIDDQFSIQKPAFSPLIYSSENYQNDITTIESSIYPNPTSNDINISLNNTLDLTVNVSVYDMKGTLVFNKNYLKLKGSNLFIENIKEQMPIGIYIMHLTGANLRSAHKLIIE